MRREPKFAILLLGILAIGLTTWIVLPSIGEQLQQQLLAYAGRESTYVVVSNNLGGPVVGLPQNATASIGGIQGVQAVYPFNINDTAVEYHNVTVTAQVNGTVREITFKNFTMTVKSAPIGLGYFPPSLINVINGRLPGDSEPGFVANCGVQNLGTRSAMMVGDVLEVSVDGIKFNATMTGRNAAPPLTNGVCLLWNQAFLRQKLGPDRFSKTFDSPGANYAVVKVNRIDDVRPVVSSINLLLREYPGYVATYDEALIANLDIFEHQSAPLYGLIGWAAPLLAASVTFMASYLSMGRRSWEPALLISQGWTRRSVLRFLVTYHATISSVAVLMAIGIAFALSSLISFPYDAYGSNVVGSFTPSITYILASIPAAYAVSISASLLDVLRVKRAGIEGALREF